ncbi:MAG TPA: site-2 protease family protein [Ktedonobacterales bacterium]|nr:site-2 protease family protein [Ktedonobacterales bacterium]
MSGSLHLGTIAGIRISAHYSWLLILALFTAWLATGWFPYTLPGPSSVTSWLTGFVAAFLLFASVLAHELTHSLVARAHGVPVRYIVLYFFGGSSNLEEEPRSPGVEFQITIAGPLTSLLIGGLAWLAYGLVLPSTPLGAEIFGFLAGMNGLLALFNLIPGFPLDGGRVLRSLLWKLTGSVQTATHWSAEVGQVVAFLLILAGIWFIVTGGLFSGLWLAVIGWFLLTAARNAETRAIRETHFQNVSIDQNVAIDRAMCSVLPVVSPGMTVQNLMEIYILPRKLAAVPVMEGEQVVGLITLTAVEQVPREARKHVVVGQIMTPRHQLQTVSPQQPLQEALALMDQHDDQHLLVMQDNHLAGIVSRDTIIRLMEILSAQGQAGDETRHTNHLHKAS